MKDKASLTLALLAVCSVGVFVAAESQWGQESRDQILEIHNVYRRNEGGCQINKLEYDEDLETEARTWAERCVYINEEGRGENLAFSSENSSERDLIISATQGWFGEKINFVVGQDCHTSGSCHYSQMVWDTTQQVGCYSTLCPQLSNTDPVVQSAWFLVCLYSPKGNAAGEKPYEKSCETPCREGQAEEDGLCVGEASVPDTGAEEGDTTDGGAGDGDATDGGAGDGDATERDARDVDAAEEGSETEGGANGDEEGGVCKDENINCLGWAATKECEKNPGYMLKSCKASCKVCVDGIFSGACDNKNDNCEAWAERGECKRNPVYMLTSCRKACEACEDQL